MRKTILVRIQILVLSVLFTSLPSYAFDQYETMNVGETKTFYFPSEVTNRASTMYAYNCSSDFINNVEVVSYTTTSVTVKALMYTQSRVNIRFDYYWYENNYGRHDTHMVHIDLNDNSGGGGNTGADYNPINYDIDYGCWGNVTLEIGQSRTFSCQYNIPIESKVKSILWSDYNQLGYEITSQSPNYCTIMARWPVTSTKLWCLMKYGNSTYKAYYNITIKSTEKPTLSLSASTAGGKVEAGSIIYLTASNSSAEIYYTLNGSTPTTYSTRYTSSGITINEDCTLRAMAVMSGYSNSPVMTWVFSVSKEENQNAIPINATNFPDANFRKYLLSQDYGADGKLTESEIQEIKKINVYARQSLSLEGIKYFTALENLNCGYNQMTSLDVSKNTSLTSLDCSSNQLSALDVSKNTALTSLVSFSNRLTSIDLPNNTALSEKLDLRSNRLSSLDLHNIMVKELLVRNNQLTSLDVSKDKDLVRLWCGKNQLTKLDVSKNQKLQTLWCGGNYLASLDVSNNPGLIRLFCHSNQLTSLCVSNTSLTLIRCYQNYIKGPEMDAFINSLPKNQTNEEHRLMLINNYGIINDGNTANYDAFDQAEGNVCTKKQVAAIKAKGWTPLYYDGSEWVEYEGSEDVPDDELVDQQAYFIENIGAGTFLTCGGNWGTHIMADEIGLDFKTHKLSDGTHWNLLTGFRTDYSQDAVGALGQEGFVDNYVDTELTFTRFDDGTYSIKAPNGTYLTADPHSALVEFKTTADDNAFARWRFIEKEELMNERRSRLSTATTTAPVDATFLIASPNMNRYDMRFYDDWLFDFGNNSWYIGVGRTNTIDTEAILEVYRSNANISSPFLLYQVVHLPAGTYKLDMQGFYCDGDFNTAAIRRNNNMEKKEVFLFVDEKSVPLKSIFDEARTTYQRGWDKRTDQGYIPSTMIQAGYALQAGAYLNEIVFYVPNESDVTIGVNGEEDSYNYNWTTIDKFHLTYYGPRRTDVQDVMTSTRNEVKGIYTITGQRLSVPRKGLNIIDGRKVFIK